MKAFKTLLATELKLSLRGMDMFIFAICLPVVVIVILGLLYGDRPAFQGAEFTFLQQSFGAVATIAVCAGGVMGLPLVVSDYRQRKILKRFKVTPSSPALILAVQVAIYTLYALASLLLVYLTAAVFFGFRFAGSWPAFLGAYALVMLSMFSIGMMVGGVAPNVKIAGAAASLLYFPMLLFSGATLPYEIMPAALQRVSDLLPLTQGIKLLKVASLGVPDVSTTPALILLLLPAAFCICISIRFFRWE